MLDTGYVDNIVDSPRCVFCGAPMVAYHTKSWTGQRWRYLSIVFKCNAADHAFSVRALSEAEWVALTAKLIRKRNEEQAHED